MRVRLAAVLAVTASLAEGCAHPGGVMVTTSAVPESGNWEYSPAAAVSGSLGLPLLIVGSLTVNGNNVSADFLTGLVVASGCSAVTSLDIVLTGSLSDSKISMTSAAWGGTVITVSGTVSSNGQAIFGDWSGKGGCADGQSGSFDVEYIPSVTGTWTGVLSTAPEASIGLSGAAVTFALQQSVTPIEFAFPLTGTVTISGSTCGFGSGSLVPATPPSPFGVSTITGPTWDALVQMEDGSQILATGMLNPTGEWTSSVSVVTGACAGALADANLTGP